MAPENTTLKRGSKVITEIDEIEFPQTGISYLEDKKIKIKNVLPGQKVKILIKKKKKDYYEGNLLEIVDNAPYEYTAICNHYDECGGCNRLTIDYNKQLEIKAEQVNNLFRKNGFVNYNFQGIIASPKIFEYRNKMEFSFGDMNRDGILQLGMHPSGRRFDVTTVNNCQLVDKDFRLILSTVLDYTRKHGFKRYHIIQREGYLRHLVIRKGLKTGEILVNLISTSQVKHDFRELGVELSILKLKGKLLGFLQTINNDYSDAVKCEELIIHYGHSYYYEELLNFKFKITPFAFFQPNTFAAEKLYETVQNFIINGDNKIIFDLYCGTGTISQLLARKAKKVYGIEIIKESVKMAEENAKINKLENCHFIAGDVLEKVDDLKEKPDLIVIDPPRPGINPKALEKIIYFQAKEMIYVSCNPKSLVRDLKELVKADYEIKKVKCVDMFPHTHHVETVVHLTKE